MIIMEIVVVVLIGLVLILLLKTVRDSGNNIIITGNYSANNINRSNGNNGYSVSGSNSNTNNKNPTAVLTNIDNSRNRGNNIPLTILFFAIRIMVAGVFILLITCILAITLGVVSMMKKAIAISTMY